MRMDLAIEAIGIPDPALSATEQGHQLANRAFRLLWEEMIYVDTQQELVDAWRVLVLAVQSQRPEWVCNGPYHVADGSMVFRGTKDYVMVFAPDATVWVGKTAKIFPAPDWKPRLSKMISLKDLIDKLKR